MVRILSFKKHRSNMITYLDRYHQNHCIWQARKYSHFSKLLDVIRGIGLRESEEFVRNVIINRRSIFHFQSYLVCLRVLVKLVLKFKSTLLTFSASFFSMLAVLAARNFSTSIIFVTSKHSSSAPPLKNLRRITLASMTK